LTTSYDAEGYGAARAAPDTELAVYRVVQEALTNVARHAEATRVDVVLTRRDGRVIAIVEDDGAGFDPSGAGDGQGLGLVGMRERAELLGGTLTVESSPGQGTTIYLEVPDGGANSAG
ncbi:MAG: sensor histidine kinase, partial [Chloroflexi bacterium]|nr:sensor histidine kinase [Chloroflexota bacterium]